MAYSTLGKIAIVTWCCVLATACGGGEESASDAPVLIGWDGLPVTSETATVITTTTAPIVVPVTPAKALRAPRPVTLPFADEAPASDSSTDANPADEASSALPRTTEAGIGITATSEPFDFGDGEQDAILFSADSGSGSVGLYLELEALMAEGDETDTIAWASSGGAVMIIFEVGPGVDLMSLESADGEVDQVEPTEESIAILAVPGDGTDGVRATGFDSAGTVVTTCTPQGEFGFITCAPPS